MGCALEAVQPVKVSAVNGHTMLSSSRCKEFCWKIQGYVFTTEVRTLPLDCCDMVLGVQWLATLGPILWDFSNLRMEFTLNGNKHVLRGTTKSDCKLIKSSSLNKLLITGPQIALLHIKEGTDSYNLPIQSSLLHLSASGRNMSTNPDMQSLLLFYADLFDTPTALPPFRTGFNHKIPYY